MKEFHEIEKKVISLLIENRKIQKIYSKKLSLEDFTLENCRRSFKAIVESQDNNLHLDLSIAVTKYGLHEVLSYGSMHNPEDIKAWYEVLRQAKAKRSLSIGANKVVNMLKKDDSLVKDIHQELIKVNTDIRLMLYGDTRKTKMQIVEDYNVKLTKAKESDGIVGLPISGIEKLDDLLNGCERTDFIVCAGRPGMGKTAHTMDILRECMSRNLSCRYYSLEMSSDQLLGRLISNISSNRYSKLSRGKVDDQRSHDIALEVFLGSKLEIIDKGSMSFDDIENDILAANESGDIDVIIIDFLQLIVDRKIKDETQVLNKVARGCKNIAKEANCVVFGLSQLNRLVEHRPNKMPMLSDLKQSGAIEEAADKVLMYYRPMYYELNPSDVFDPTIWDGLNQDRIIVAKNRSGRIGNCNVTFEYDKMGFIDKSEDMSNIIATFANNQQMFNV